MAEVNFILSDVIRVLAWFVLIVAVYGYLSIAARVSSPDTPTNSYHFIAWHLDWWFLTPLLYASLTYCIVAFSDKQWFIGILMILSDVFFGVIGANLLPKNLRQIEDRPDPRSHSPLDRLSADEKSLVGCSVVDAVLFLTAITTLASLHFGWKWYSAVIVCAATYIGAIVWVLGIVFWLSLRLKTRQSQASFNQDQPTLAE